MTPAQAASAELMRPVVTINYKQEFVYPQLITLNSTLVTGRTGCQIRTYHVPDHDDPVHARRHDSADSRPGWV